ncbi:MAG TPA: cysteine--tRNA ligase [Acidimicrobiales bacterium]|nr:cysteine--tRNA ligase [Acidimicrobiales bacterium]
MRLYETRAARVVPFDPPGSVVRLYVCGITPYDATHVGHAATFLTYDVLQRRLRDIGHETRCVRNITDVDDDILARAAAEGVHYLDLAAGALRTFGDDMEALGVLKPWSAPRATSAISDIRSFVGRVLESGHAYEARGSVFFDTSTAPDFGVLSGRRAEDLPPVAPDGAPEGARHPQDFVLWQKARTGEPSWDSLWGPGRPGWHVECSVLALRELGPRIDLHGGGSDLIYPHHECEMVQAEAVTGTEFVGHWMHTAMVHLDGEKMAKSTGNLEFIADLRHQHDPMAIRLALISHHYRRPWEWSTDLLVGAEEKLARWREAGAGDAALEEVRAALDDDLDIPAAVAAIDDAVARGRGVSRARGLLGVL